MDGWLTISDLAARFGWTLGTAYTYAKPWRQYVPPADERVGQSPIWRIETIEAWDHAGRPNAREREVTGWRAPTLAR